MFKIGQKSAILIVILLVITVQIISSIELANIIRNDTLARNVEIVSNYNKDVWNKHYSGLKDLSYLGEDELENNTDIYNLINDTVKFFANIPSVKIEIYNKFGTKFISSSNFIITTEKQVTNNLNLQNTHLIIDYLEDFITKARHKIYPDFILLLDYKKAIDNGLKKVSPDKAVAYISTLSRFLNNKNFLITGTLITSFVPLTLDNKDMTGIIVITEDLTYLWKEIHWIRFNTLMLIITLILCITYLLSYKIRNYSELISQQQKQYLETLENSKKITAKNKTSTALISYSTTQINNILQNIITLISAMKNEILGKIDNISYKEYIEDIYESSNYLQNSISDINNYAGSELNNLELNYSIFDVRKLIISCINVLNFKGKTSAIELNKTIPDESCIILADQQRLKQSLISIISNAIDTTPTGGEIKIIVNITSDLYSPQQINIIIEDTGIGINETDLQSMIEPNNHHNKIYDFINQKLAIGFILTKTLIELMNGKFSISSKIGIGTKITISFFRQDEQI